MVRLTNGEADKWWGADRKRSGLKLRYRLSFLEAELLTG
jgi:hypothetical protein